jgi:ATP phosphoribosyltransferase regulatory subunit
MSEQLSRIPSGLRYYSAQDAQVRRMIEETAMSVFDGWSYEEIITPTVDYYSLFEVGMGQLEAQRAFRFNDGDGPLLALRPEVTSGIARAAATLFARDDRPLRFCYASPVFRQQSPSHWRGRRESTQIGCELLGHNSTAADIEMLVIVTEVLTRLGLGERFVITLSDVEIFNGIVEQLGLDFEARAQLRHLIDIRAIADLECFLAAHASVEECAAFADLIQISGKEEIFEKARRVVTNPRSCVALEDLEGLWTILESLEISRHFEIDLGDVSRLDYYTGLTFTVFVEGFGARIGSGGRYDNLTARFGKAEPAVGFVLDLDALAERLKDREEFVSTQREDRAFLKLTNNDVASLFGKAMALRDSDERVKISTD